MDFPSKLETREIDDERRYLTPEGNLYPSVTSLLGKISDNSYLEKWKKRVGEEQANKISFQARNRGTSVHAVVEKYINNEKISGQMPHIQRSLLNLKPVLDKSLNNIRFIEQSLYSDELRVSGTPDIIAEWDGKLSIIDIKTSKKPKTQKQIPVYFTQTCLYALMYKEHNKIMPFLPANLVIVMDVDNSYPRVFIEKTTDWINIAKSSVSEYYKKFPETI